MNSQRIHPLHKSFAEHPVRTAVAVTAVFFLATGGVREAVKALLALGVHQDQIAAAIQQGVLALAFLALLVRMGWANRAGITSRVKLNPGRWLLPITLSGFLPIIGLIETDWSQRRQIVVSIFDFLTTALVEELAFRSLILSGLLLGLRNQSRSPFRAVVISAILFGLPHIHPVIIVFATIYGLGFAHVTIATRSIWPAVAVHAAFDLFTDLPQSTADASNDLLIGAALLLVLTGAIVVLRRAWQVTPEMVLHNRVEPNDHPRSAPLL